MSDAPRAARLGLLALTFFRESHACETLELPVHQPVRAPVERRVVREPLRLLRSARRRNMPRGAPPPRYGSAARHM
jgi:hypothetical protein